MTADALWNLIVIVTCVAAGGVILSTFAAAVYALRQFRKR